MSDEKTPPTPPVPKMASSILQKARLEQVIRGQGRVIAKGTGLDTTETKSRWRD